MHGVAGFWAVDAASGIGGCWQDSPVVASLVACSGFQLVVVRRLRLEGEGFERFRAEQREVVRVRRAVAGGFAR